MKTFKFFKNNFDTVFRDETLPLLPNEQMLHYWNDGEEQDLLTARVIVWADHTYRQDMRWEFRRFDGTMEMFFQHRRNIVPIRTIQGNGVFYHCFDHTNESPEMRRNFEGNVQYTIYYYHYHEVI